MAIIYIYIYICRERDMPIHREKVQHANMETMTKDCDTISLDMAYVRGNRVA